MTGNVDSLLEARSGLGCGSQMHALDLNLKTLSLCLHALPRHLHALYLYLSVLSHHLRHEVNKRCLHVAIEVHARECPQI